MVDTMLNLSLKKYQHFSFDLDGTLVDSLDIMEIAWRNVIVETGISVPFIRFKKHIGLPFDVIMRHLDLVDVADEIAECYFKNTADLAPDIKVFEGAKAFLDFLGRQGKVVSVITSKPRANAYQILDNNNYPEQRRIYLAYFAFKSAIDLLTLSFLKLRPSYLALISKLLILGINV